MPTQLIPGAYNIGTITLTAGSKVFTTKGTALLSSAGVMPGDTIYNPKAAKELIIASVTDDTSGTLVYNCPDDCAGTDIPVHINFGSSSSRTQGSVSQLIDMVSRGYLASLAKLKADKGQFLRVSSVSRELEPVDMNADVIGETQTHKVMTEAERNKLSGINGLEQKEWNEGKNATEALISPQKLQTTIKDGYQGSLSNGWTKLPNGLILQWGYIFANNSDYAQVFFPTAFTRNVIFIPKIAQAWALEPTSYSVHGDWADNNLSWRGIYCTKTTASRVEKLTSWTVFWIAIGY